MDGNATKHPRSHSRRGSRPPGAALSRPLLASTAVHATLLGAGLLWGLWAAGGRPLPRRLATTTFAASEAASLAPEEREVLVPREPADPREPELRESEVWSEREPLEELVVSPELPPAPRSVDWLPPRPFLLGNLAPDPVPPEPTPALVSEPRIYEVAQPPLVSEPRPLDVPPPAYPRLARRAGEEGSVLCSLALDAEGRVLRVEVLESSGFERLDEAARTTLAGWRFEPRRENGRAVPGVVRHRVTFRLGEG